jgi:hypothetical protein
MRNGAVMTWLKAFLVGVCRWTNGFLAWIAGGLGAFITLAGVAGLYYGEYDVWTFSLLGLGLVVTVGAAVAYNKFFD